MKSIDKIYKNIDLAVSACGGAAFELGYLGIPTIHVTSEKREIDRAKIILRILKTLALTLNKILMVKLKMVIV